MAAQKALAGIAWTPERVHAFTPVCAVNPFGALQSAGELVDGCYLYQHKETLIALQRDVFSGGVRVHVQALVNLDPATPLQYRHAMQEIETTARMLGADVLTMCTQHPAMAHGAPRWGGAISGAVIAKYLRIQ